MNLITWDIKAFEFINFDLSNPFFDSILPLMREPLFWVPLYAFLITFVFFNYGKKGYWVIIFLVLAASSSDLISSRVIKKSIKRIRPCNTEFVHTIQRVDCGSGYSFTSSHAANHFTVASFIVLTLGQNFRKIIPFCWSWAGIVSFSQVYVGVHYPLDIMCGAILGILVGRFWSFLFNKYYSHTLEGQ